MGFSTKQVQALRRKLNGRQIRTREVNGRELSYIEGWFAISEANRIFGFDGWSRETVESRCVLTRENRGTFVRADSVCADDSGSSGSTASNQAQVASTCDTIARSFLRLERTDSRIFERLGRYEINLWRQTVQTILLLNVMSRHVNDNGQKSSPTYFRCGTQKTSQHLRWPPIKPFLYD